MIGIGVAFGLVAAALVVLWRAFRKPS